MFINYEKLANKILSNNEFRETLTRQVAINIGDHINESTDFVEYVKNNLYIEERGNYDRHYGIPIITRIDMLSYVSERVAERLVPDVYDLNKAEILKEVSSKGILNLLQEKLEEKARQHVLQFISKE